MQSQADTDKQLIQKLQAEAEETRRSNFEMRSQLEELAQQINSKQIFFEQTLADYESRLQHSQGMQQTTGLQLNAIHAAAYELNNKVNANETLLNEKEDVIASQALTLANLQRLTHTLRDEIAERDTHIKILEKEKTNLQDQIFDSESKHELEVNNLKARIEEHLSALQFEKSNKQTVVDTVMQRIDVIRHYCPKQNIFMCANQLRRIKRIEGMSFSTMKSMTLHTAHIINMDAMDSDEMRRHSEEDPSNEEDSTGAVSGRGCLTLMASGPTSCSEVAVNGHIVTGTDCTVNPNSTETPVTIASPSVSPPVTVVRRLTDKTPNKNTLYFFFFSPLRAILVSCFVELLTVEAWRHIFCRRCSLNSSFNSFSLHTPEHATLNTVVFL